MAKVYFISARGKNVNDSLAAKLERLLGITDLFSSVIGSSRTIFIKTNFSQIGYTRYLRPIFLRIMVEKVREMGGKPVVTDSTSFSPHLSLAGERWFFAADLMGYSELSLGCERILANGYEGGDGEFISTGGKELGGVEVARVIKEAVALVIVSHVTGHPLTGLCGALVNLGVECLNNAGKTRLFQGIVPIWSKKKCKSCKTCIAHCEGQALTFEDSSVQIIAGRCYGCGACVMACPNKALFFDKEQINSFQLRVAEASRAVVKTLGKPVVYLNFLMDVVPQPDRIGWADTPFIPDVGILASSDPVAVDFASWEMIIKFPGIPYSAAEDYGVLNPGQEKLEAITGVRPELMFAYAEELGVGSREVEILV